MIDATQVRFEELLPWYANGSIGAEDKLFVERYLEGHPEARPELDWFHSISARMQENAPAVPATIGWTKTMARIRSDRPTLAERFGRVVNAIFGSNGPRPALAFAGLAVIAVQAGFIFSTLHGAKDDPDGMRALRPSAVVEGPMLKVNFAADATEADIRFLLLSVQGSLAGGPGQLGDYYVRVPAGKEEAFAAQIRAAAFVQSVTLAPGVPPRE